MVKFYKNNRVDGEYQVEEKELQKAFRSFCEERKDWCWPFMRLATVFTLDYGSFDQEDWPHIESVLDKA